MKKYTTFILLFLLALPLLSLTNESGIPNSTPIVSNVQITVMQSIQTVKITYDLYDPESDPMEVTLRISNDSGKTYLFPCDSVSGDVGYPVYSGNQKQIFWYYTTTSSLLKAKIIANDLHPVEIQNLVNQVDSNRLKENLQFITGIRHRTAGDRQLQRVKDSIYNRFLMYNFQTSIQNFPYFGYNAQNFLGRHPGTTSEDTTYIVDGHYETVSNSPGADDNGTAVAAFLEIARILSDYSFRNTIKFIGFDLEEVGLGGSINYVGWGIPVYEKIAGVFNSDLIGYYSDVPNSQVIPAGFCTLFPELCDSIIAQQYKGNFIFNAANEYSNPLRYRFDSCARLYVPQLRVLSFAVPGNGQIAPDLRRSDHAPFWDAGYMALFFSDGANFRNPNYHTPGDTVGTLNIQFMTNVVKAILATVSSAAGIENSSVAISGLFVIVGVNQISAEIPKVFKLMQNYPNPFNPITKIKFDIRRTSNTKLIIYNELGKEIKTLVNEKLSAGTYEVNWNASDFPSGVYFFELKTPDFNQTKRMVLLK